MSTKVEESLEDLLHQIDQKAEIVNHQIILLPPAGGLDSHASGEILFSLWEYTKEQNNGLAFGNNTAFMVNLPHRSHLVHVPDFMLVQSQADSSFFKVRRFLLLKFATNLTTDHVLTESEPRSVSITSQPERW